MNAMQRFGKGFMFVSALLWVVAGTIVFSSPRSGNMPLVAQGSSAAHTIGMQVATANAALPDSSYSATPTEETVVNSTVSDASGALPWEGPYYLNTEVPSNAQLSDVSVMPVVPLKPWYEQYFGGFGTMFHDLFSPDSTALYGTDPTQVAQPAKPLPPACTISIIPNSVPYGGSATVTWTSRNADHVIFQGVGEVSRSGSIPVGELTSTRALALAVVGAEGLSSSCYTVVNVEPLVVENPTCVISANPSTIKAGDTVDLSWGSENAATAKLNDQGKGTDQGPVATVGGTTLTPKTTTTYALTVESAVGVPATCNTTVTVN